MSTPQNKEQLVKAVLPTLDAFVASAQPYIKRTTDDIYEALLNSCQDYIRENVEWNIGGDIERCRDIEAENRRLCNLHHELVEALEGLLDAHHGTGEGQDESERHFCLSDALERAEAALAKAKAGAA